MKVFDSEDRAIIEKIAQTSNSSKNLINLLDSRNNLQGTRIVINNATKEGSFLFEILKNEPTSEEIDWGIKKQQEIIELLIKHVILLRHLEKEELAIFFTPAKNTEQEIMFGAGAVNMHSFSMAIEDTSIINLVANYAHKEIIPSPSLKKLVNNKFLTDDDIKFNKQFNATWLAIIVSIILGLYGMYNNHQNSINEKEQFIVQLKESKNLANLLALKIEGLDKSKIDYRQSLKSISKELINITNKVNLVPKTQIIEIKLPSESKKENKKYNKPIKDDLPKQDFF